MVELNHMKHIKEIKKEKGRGGLVGLLTEDCPEEWRAVVEMCGEWEEGGSGKKKGVEKMIRYLKKKGKIYNRFFFFF